MNYTDRIYYNATTTDASGTQMIYQGEYYCPFLDFFLVFCVLTFTVLTVWFAHYLLYPRESKIRIKNHIKIISRGLKKYLSEE
jgi:hypothetical protein